MLYWAVSTDTLYRFTRITSYYYPQSATNFNPLTPTVVICRPIWSTSARPG